MECYTITAYITIVFFFIYYIFVFVTACCLGQVDVPHVLELLQMFLSIGGVASVCALTVGLVLQWYEHVLFFIIYACVAIFAIFVEIAVYLYYWLSEDDTNCSDDIGDNACLIIGFVMAALQIPAVILLILLAIFALRAQAQKKDDQKDKPKGEKEKKAEKGEKDEEKKNGS